MTFYLLLMDRHSVNLVKTAPSFIGSIRANAMQSQIGPAIEP